MRNIASTTILATKNLNHHSGHEKVLSNVPESSMLNVQEVVSVRSGSGQDLITGGGVSGDCDLPLTWGEGTS